jgi:hypothetical protein
VPQLDGTVVQRGIALSRVSVGRIVTLRVAEQPLAYHRWRGQCQTSLPPPLASSRQGSPRVEDKAASGS